MKAINGSEVSDQEKKASQIGTLRETSLHAELKAWYAKEGDLVEEPVSGYLVDIVRGDELVEIQTGNFSALKDKLAALLPDFRVRVVTPIAQERWIRRITRDGQTVGRRKSPKRGRYEDIFSELLRIPHLAQQANFSLELLLVQDEVVWRDDGRGSWRRKGWSVADRRLLKVIEGRVLTGEESYRKFMPPGLEQPFTNPDLAKRLKLRRPLAQRMTYCLKMMGIIDEVGKSGRFKLYEMVKGREPLSRR